MMRRLLLVVVVLAALGALGWLGTRPRPSSPGGEATSLPARAPGHALPDLTLTDYDGRTVPLRDLRGTPLVVNSWAAWCPFCVKELPDFAEVQKEFGNRVQMIAVNRGEPLETTRGFTDELGISDTLLYLLDPEDEFYRSIGGFTMPETLFVNAEGQIVFQKRGVMAREEIRERVTELLNQGPR